ncbi:kinase-like protein [Exidia glandulosa HHB12029]|uniref:Kinase-like protein n=1 Tax=Exidia glandulosa HHB12029 TaxID=1314781 RepID=A0A165KZ50_EXIGL|nr:kinase-like protein [Exidia glandulosa HHB12029]
MQPDLSNRISVRTPVVRLHSTAFSEIYAGDLDDNGNVVPVALKRLRYNVGAEAKKDVLRREIAALVYANHVNAHVLAFLGTCQVKQLDDDICIVSEWAAEGDVMSYLSRNPDASRRDILRQVALGLSYLHAPYDGKSIVHGDLHPGNVLIKADKTVLICDFGLCHVVPDGHAASFSGRIEGAPQGRLAYLAPELFDTTDPRSRASDTYSFGILAWELFAGYAPYSNRAAGMVASLVQLCQGKRPPREEIKRSDFEDDIWSVVTDCWDSAPTKRPSMDSVHMRLSAPHSEGNGLPKSQPLRWVDRLVGFASSLWTPTSPQVRSSSPSPISSRNSLLVDVDYEGAALERWKGVWEV